MNSWCGQNRTKTQKQKAKRETTSNKTRMVKGGRGRVGGTRKSIYRYRPPPHTHPREEKNQISAKNGQMKSECNAVQSAPLRPATTHSAPALRARDHCCFPPPSGSVRFQSIPNPNNTNLTNYTKTFRPQSTHRTTSNTGDLKKKF